MKRLSFALFVSLAVSISACASMDRSFSANGLYLLHPTYGMLGLGTVEYDSKKPDAEKLEKLIGRLDEMEEAVKYLLQKLIKPEAKKEAL